jgi:hypothetical protein
MNRCDWIDCYKVGLWDGVGNILLNAEGRKNVRVTEAPTRFTYLCPKHFRLGVGSLNQGKVDAASQK